MSGFRVLQMEEKQGGDIMSWKCQKSSTSPVLQVADLSGEIKQLVKEGKITVHSVLSIWVGSPFGAVEAFKQSETVEHEIETKFSSAIQDIIDILQNLQREDTLTFWNDGPKDRALRSLVPLAKDTVHLSRKLDRITTMLENYYGELQKTVDYLIKRTSIKNEELDHERSIMKPLKSGNCWKFRKVMRNAWYTLSRMERKQVEAGEVKGQESLGDDTQSREPTAGEETQAVTVTIQAEQSPNLGVQPMMMMTPTQNKSESARLSQQPNRCDCHHGCGCGNHMCSQQQYHEYQQQRRARIVPPPFTIQDMHREQKRQQEKHPCQHHHCEGSQGVGDVPQPTLPDEPEGTVRAEVNPNTEPEKLHPETPVTPEVIVHSMESQPFQVSENSYLQEYEEGGHLHRAEFDLTTPLILPVTGGDSEKLPGRRMGSHKKCSGQVGTGLCIKEVDSNENKNVDNNNERVKEGEEEEQRSNDMDSLSKEVVVVRSAVSDFAESEYGVIDPEDMDWLNKIKEIGQTGQICADELEQAEKLKRQSIFMNCVKYRADEAHKDVLTVVHKVREVERKWVNRKQQQNFMEGEEERGNLGNFELSQLIYILSQFCRDWVDDVGVKTMVDATGGGVNINNNNFVEEDREVILDHLTNVVRETTACHRSFKRFSRMVRTDMTFLKNLCFSFPPILDPPIQAKREEGEEDTGRESQLSPNLERPTRSNHNQTNPTCCDCNFEQIFD